MGLTTTARRKTEKWLTEKYSDSDTQAIRRFSFIFLSAIFLSSHPARSEVRRLIRLPQFVCPPPLECGTISIRSGECGTIRMRSGECGVRNGVNNNGAKEDRKMVDRRIFRFTHASYSAFFIYFSVSDFSVFSPG